MRLNLLAAAATGTRVDQANGISDWLLSGWHWLWALGAGGVALALIRFAPTVLTFLGGERQRRHEKAAQVKEQRDRDRARLGPGLREMIAVGRELEGIAVRLTEYPAQEYPVAGAPLQRLRDRLHAVQEPDLGDLRDRFHDSLTSVQQWRARVQGSYEDRQQQLSPVDQHRLDRINRHEDEDRPKIRALTAEAEAWLAKLEEPVA